MERVWHPYIDWEDFQNGMYETTCFMDNQEMINQCESLLGCWEWLEESMKFVLIQWEKACEQHLTNIARNRQAWLGQSACCLTHGAPEYITKIAWNNLSQEKQVKANEVADYVIKMFEEKMERKQKWLNLN